MTTPFHEAFREELLASATRQAARRHRRRRRLQVAVAAAGAAAVSAVGLALASDPVSADVTVEIVDGYLEVEIRGASTSDAEVLDALRDRGVDASVSEAPTGPSRIGHFTGAFIEPEPRSPSFDAIRMDDLTARRFRVRADFAGTLVVVVGRAAQPGESYDAATMAFADDEPLDCSGVLGLTVADAARAVDQLDPPVRIVSVRTDSVEGLQSATLADALDGPERSMFVVDGSATSATEVHLLVGPSPVPEEGGC